ncbi:MAG: hypothetical protein ABEH43_07200, partial [Flavobacteriales bacterium]
MKKLYTLLFTFVLCLNGFTQKSSDIEKQQLDYEDPKKTKKEPQAKDLKDDPDNKSPRAVWEEDFSGGIPASWTNQGTDANGNSISNPWEYRGTSTTPDNSVGGRGCCSSGNPVSSATQGNGFIIFDSNYRDDRQGICGGGCNSGTSPAPQDVELITDTIDLSGANSLTLSFYQYYLNFDSRATVEASIDGGSSWMELFNNDDVGANSSTDFDDQVKVNVGCEIGGESNVLLKFRFNGDYYEWMIDDIKLEKPNDHELAMTNELYLPKDKTREMWTYKMIPRKQIFPMDFLADIENKGNYDETNVGLNINLNGPATFNSTSTIDTMKLCGSNNPNSFKVSNSSPSTAMGKYMVNFNAVYDSSGLEADPQTNIAQDSFEVTDDVYGKDEKLSGPFDTWTNDSTLEFEVSTTYEMFQQDTVESMPVAIDAYASDTGAEISGLMYATHSLSTNHLQAGIVGASDNADRFLTGSDLEPDTVLYFANGDSLGISWINIPLYPLDANGDPNTSGDLVLPTDDHLGTDTVLYSPSFVHPEQTDPVTGDTLSVEVVSSGSLGSFPDVTSQWIVNSTADGVDLFYIDETPMIRLNLKGGAAGLSEIVMDITDEHCGQSDGEVDITGVIGGESPYEYSFDGGSFSSQTTYSGLSAGTYTVTVKDNKGNTLDSTITLSDVAGPSGMYTSTQDATCGDSTGQLSVDSVSQGTPPYMYSIDMGTFTSDTLFTGLAPDSHIVTVKDDGGCTYTDTITIGNISGPSDMMFTINQPSTCDTNDGSYEVDSVVGGTAPYEYSIDGGTTFSVGDTIDTNLTSGVYEFMVKDDNGCTYSENVSINDLSGPSDLMLTSTADTCGKGVGEIEVDSVVGSTATPFEYEINGNGFSSVDSFSNLMSGKYDI